MRLSKKLICTLFFLEGMLCSPSEVWAYSYGIGAESVLKQARLGNVQYFQLLKRYGSAIDTVDQSGNTAYCMALKVNDQKTMNFLAAQGANVRHSCVKRVLESRQRAQEVAEQREVKMRNRVQSHGVYKKASTGNNYLWYGLGALAIGGGVAAALSGGGGGSSHHGGSSDGGGGVNPDAQKFKTAEYTSGNFLSGINAAEAYAHIYNSDSKGNIYSHQANSDAALAKIKVGVLDSGVYANSDLSGKVKRAYDLNPYNEVDSFYSYIKDSGDAVYVIKKSGKYYVMQYTREAGYQFWASANSKGEIKSVDFTLNDVEKMLQSEFKLSFSDLAAVNANGSAAPGASMQDLSFDFSNPEVMLGSWYAYMTELSHGTHVSGIIAANKNDKGMHGVAFENAQLYEASWDIEQAIYPTVKSMVDEGVSVINNSWNSVYDPKDAPYDARNADMLIDGGIDNALASYIYAAKNNAVWVQAAGNEGHAQPGIYSGMPLLDLSAYGYDGAGKYEAPYVAVVALDPVTASSAAPAGGIASYSNHCGVAKEYCLAAPGSYVNSTGAASGGTLNMSGTSMAAPVVSGSIALLNGYYPWLSSQNVAWLLLETANRNGLYSDASIYGKGALDLERAITTPIGGLGLPTTTNFSNMKTATNSKLSLSTAMKANRKLLPKTVTAFDVLHRPFAYDTSSMVTATHASNANFRNEVAHAAVSKPKKVIKDEKSGFTFSSYEALDKGGQEHLSEVEVVHETDKGTTRFYYAENSQYATPESAVKPTGNPYLAMNEAYGAENTLKLSDVSRLKLSLQTGENGLYGRDYEQDHQSFDERAYAMGAEYSFDLTDYLELSALGGLLYEEEAMLGMNGRGGLALKDGSTYYAGIKAAFNVTPNFSILAAYYRGYTQGRDASLMSISDVETESFMIAGEYKFNKQNKLGLSLMSPMSVVKGRSSFRYASGRDNYSDTVYMRKLTSSLRPAAKEYDLGLYYIGEPEDDLNLTGKVEARFNADGEKGVTDYLGIVGVSKSF